MDSVIRRIVIFQLLQEGKKSNDTRDVELARDEKLFKLENAELIRDLLLTENA